MSNMLIVESKNDKIFIEKLIAIMNLDNIEIDEPICVQEYDCLDGLNKTKLINESKYIIWFVLLNFRKRPFII